MLNSIKLENILFVDIETVPQYASYSSLPDRTKALWDAKSKYLVADGQNAGDVYPRAGIYAEFGRIICISSGVIVKRNNQLFLRVKSFSQDDEATLLNDFANLLRKFSQKPDATLCAHNGKEFDYPYIARRMLINGVELPEMLSIAGKKPWEVKLLDTMELWRFGDYKHYTSLNLLTHIFSIPSPKSDIDGSQVAEVYYLHNDLKRIVEYCERDVLAIAQLLLRYRNEPLIHPDNLERVEQEP